MSKYPRVSDEQAQVIADRKLGQSVGVNALITYARDLLDARAIIEAKDEELAALREKQLCWKCREKIGGV